MHVQLTVINAVILYTFKEDFVTSEFVGYLAQLQEVFGAVSY